MIKAKKNLLWFGIFSIIMIFAGLTSAYIVSKGSQFWVHFSVPNEFLWSTICVVAGSVALFFAIKSIKSNNSALNFPQNPRPLHPSSSAIGEETVLHYKPQPHNYHISPILPLFP